MATDRKRYAVQVTACVPDNTGMLRVRTTGLSDLYDWTPKTLEECRRREEERTEGSAEILGPLSREEYSALQHGYRQTPDGPVTYRSWEPMI